MDWNVVIDRNREALKGVLAALVAMAGAGAVTSPLWGSEGRERHVAHAGRAALGTAPFTSPLWGGRRVASGGGRNGADTPTRRSDYRPGRAACLARPSDPHKGEVKGALVLPRHLYRAILRLLRPAEAAVRRLVIVIALTAMPPARSAAQHPSSPSSGGEVPRGSAAERGAALRRVAGPVGSTALAFPILDPLKRWHLRHCRPLAVPRISLPGITVPHPLPAPSPPPRPDDRIDATRLALRLRALAAVLDDLPRHARRFARWHATTEAAGQTAGAKPVRRLTPLRPGFAPGQRRRRVAHEVHEVLADMQHFARAALELSADTS